MHELVVLVQQRRERAGLQSCLHVLDSGWRDGENGAVLGKGKGREWRAIRGNIEIQFLQTVCVTCSHLLHVEIFAVHVVRDFVAVVLRPIVGTHQHPHAVHFFHTG